MGKDLVITLIVIVYILIGCFTARLLDPEPIEDDPEDVAEVCILSFFWFVTLPAKWFLD